MLKTYYFQGKYLVVFDTVFPCELKQHQKIQYNLYLSKKSSNLTEVRGNITVLTPLDDSTIVSKHLTVTIVLEQL